MGAQPFTGVASPTFFASCDARMVWVTLLVGKVGLVMSRTEVEFVSDFLGAEGNGIHTQQFVAGDVVTIDDELATVAIREGAAVAVGAESQSVSDHTVAELKTILGEAGVEIPKRSIKADLVAMVENLIADSDEETASAE